MSHATVDRAASEGALPVAARGERSSARRGRFGPLRWAARQLPAVLAFGLLAGLGFYGHSVEWKLPKFSAIAGAPTEERRIASRSSNGPYRFGTRHSVWASGSSQ